MSVTGGTTGGVPRGLGDVAAATLNLLFFTAACGDCWLVMRLPCMLSSALADIVSSDALAMTVSVRFAPAARAHVRFVVLRTALA